MQTEEQLEERRIELANKYKHDPLGFVFVSWPDVEPHKWQQDTLEDISTQLALGSITTFEAIQIAVASGHGIGKSCLVAWLILWAITTCPDTKGVVTANTENQLKTKTWAELAKWYNDKSFPFASWFKLTATALFSSNPKHEKTWRIDMIAWSERNTEAFAGLHNAGKRILLIMDEASAIPDAIWEVSEGALTDEDTEIIWAVFGNPTRNLGRFFECFHSFKHRWLNKQIDSRDVLGTNKVKIQEWADDHGVDSDFFRVRVRGLFPHHAANALFSRDELERSIKVEHPIGSQDHAADILGVDVARQGDDQSVIAHRKGLVALSLRAFRIPDTMLVATQVAMQMDKCKPDGVFVDETGGYGAGVVDALRVMNKTIIGVQFSAKASDARYFNKRSEMYFLLADWVKRGGKLPNDPELIEELLAIEYNFSNDKLRIIDKDMIKSIIGRSPDKADALALTFAYPVSPKLPFGSESENDRSAGHDPYSIFNRRG